MRQRRVRGAGCFRNDLGHSRYDAADSSDQRGIRYAAWGKSARFNRGTCFWNTGDVHGWHKRRRRHVSGRGHDADRPERRQWHSNSTHVHRECDRRWPVPGDSGGSRCRRRASSLRLDKRAATDGYANTDEYASGHEYGNANQHGDTDAVLDNDANAHPHGYIDSDNHAVTRSEWAAYKHSDANSDPHRHEYADIDAFCPAVRYGYADRNGYQPT
jgi:hypothetical protein